MTCLFSTIAITAIVCACLSFSIEAFTPFVSSNFGTTTVSSSHSIVLTSKRRFGSTSSPLFLSSSTPAEEDNTSEEEEDDGSIDISSDPRLYRIRLPRAPGIEWGTDLSFSFVYVRAMEPAGPASISGQVGVNHQICEIRPVLTTSDEAPTPINLIGAPFDEVMQTFANLDRTIIEVDLVFFRGTKEELKAACAGSNNSTPEKETITITVIQNNDSKNKITKTITAPVGANIRQTLVDEGINVYQSLTRWTNCKGKQLCGTCIVNVKEGGMNTNRKSMDEASTLRENPDTYRLSCVTFAYDDVTVETFPPIKAAQWTR